VFIYLYDIMVVIIMYNKSANNEMLQPWFIEEVIVAKVIESRYTAWWSHLQDFSFCYDRRTDANRSLGGRLKGAAQSMTQWF
jgi:hypothetical protein